MRATGATPVLATHANAFMQRGNDDRHLLYAWERFYGQVIVAFDSAAKHVTLEVASEANIPAVDLAAHLSASDKVIFSDFSHFTDYGAARVAEALAPALFDASVAGDACGTS